jgi:hypothetical protein
MSTCIHLWLCLAECFLEWQMLETKFVKKMKSHSLLWINFFLQKPRRLWNNVEKCGTAREAINSNKQWRIRFAFWIIKATETCSECIILLFHSKKSLHKRAWTLHYVYIACLLLTFCEILNSFYQILYRYMHIEEDQVPNKDRSVVSANFQPGHSHSFSSNNLSLLSPLYLSLSLSPGM